MKLGIAKLKDGENAFEFAQGKDAWVDALLARLDAQGTPIQSFATQFQLTKLEPDYYLKGRLHYETEQVCSRCAEPLTLPIDGEFAMGLAHVEGAAEDTENTLSEESEELDIEYFRSNEIDLDPLLEEQILLNLPYTPVCRPDCKGLCQSCGANRNTQTCQCRKQNPLNPFAVLAKEVH